MKSIFLAPQGITVEDFGFSKYYKMNPNTPFQSIANTVTDAAMQYIIPYISQEMYDDIADKLEAQTQLSIAQTKFLDLLRSANAFCAAMIFVPLNTNNSSMLGNMRDSTDKASLSSIPEIRFSLWQITLQADKRLDLLCEFLENAVAQNDTDFDLFKNSKAYNRSKSPFFRTTAQFNDYFNIFNSRSTFIAINRAICDISEDVIAPILCNDLFLRLVELVENNDNGNAYEQKILHLVRRSVAHLAIAKSVLNLQCVIESDGIKYVSNNEGRSNQTNAVAQHREKAMQLRNGANYEGEQCLNALRKYLKDNAQNIPQYANSPCHAALTARQSAYGAGVTTDNGMGAFIYKRR